LFAGLETETLDIKGLVDDTMEERQNRERSERERERTPHVLRERERKFAEEMQQ